MCRNLVRLKWFKYNSSKGKSQKKNIDSLKFESTFFRLIELKQLFSAFRIEKEKNDLSSHQSKKKEKKQNKKRNKCKRKCRYHSKFMPSNATNIRFKVYYKSGKKIHNITRHMLIAYLNNSWLTTLNDYTQRKQKQEKKRIYVIANLKQSKHSRNSIKYFFSYRNSVKRIIVFGWFDIFEVEMVYKREIQIYKACLTHSHMYNIHFYK